MKTNFKAMVVEEYKPSRIFDYFIFDKFKEVKISKFVKPFNVKASNLENEFTQLFKYLDT